MRKPIKVLVVGVGNLGQSVLRALPNYTDLVLAGVVTRNPERVRRELGRAGLGIFHANDEGWRANRPDVAILCGGSKEDLPEQGPHYAQLLSTVDSFDTHAHIGPYTDEASGRKMRGYLKTMDSIARQNKHAAHVCIGWDPGSFSLMRAYFSACLGGSRAYAFYGLTERGGLSMGHSNAVRDNVPGVLDARSYTHANPEAIERVRSGENPDLTEGDMHWREVLVVAKPGADLEEIRRLIQMMPNYFAPYRTTVKFVSEETLRLEHASLVHDGIVIAVSSAGIMEFKNQWHSNPDGTAGIMLAYARSTVWKKRRGVYGTFTSLDTPVSQLLAVPEERIKLV